MKNEHEVDALDSVLRKSKPPSDVKIAHGAFDEVSPDRTDMPRGTVRIDPMRGIHLKVRAELGRNRMLLKDALELEPGSVVDLEKLAEDPVDLYVNDLLVARGEVLLVNNSFCVRIIEVLPVVSEVES